MMNSGKEWKSFLINLCIAKQLLHFPNWDDKLPVYSEIKGYNQLQNCSLCFSDGFFFVIIHVKTSSFAKPVPVNLATEENITQFGSAYQSLRKCHFKGIAQAMQLEKDSAVLVLQPEHAQIYLTYPIWSKRLWKVKNPSAAS